MHKEFLMGNEAIAMGAIAAGVNLVCGYPGTPSTEVLETVAKHSKENQNIYVEWSVNEKAAVELAAGAAYSGARTLITMKQVGLNVASDPVMCLEYIGVKGATVIMVADDPGPISSQTEQDTRAFASYSKIPCFDPSSVAEAYEMIIEAFEYSEKYNTPVFFRPTTRICHAYASIDVKEPEDYYVSVPEGFVKDSSKWVIFPRLSYNNHLKINERETVLSDDFSKYNKNIIKKCQDRDCRKGIISGGISYAYVNDCLHSNKADLLKISTPYPFPEKLAVEFLSDLDEVLCIEELDPVIERAITYVCGKYNLNVKVFGKLSGHISGAGENTADSVKNAIDTFLGVNTDSAVSSKQTTPPQLPVRPPVLCAGCPHRASFYAVKEAMKGQKTLFAGDIGCYTLGNAQPLDMVDTCLCMGAGVNIAQGVNHISPDTKCFAFVGDSTFFASAVTGAINALYNNAQMTLVVLDNSTTAMTGHQPHPGTGRNAVGEIANKISIENVLKGIGLETVVTLDPFELQKSIDTVKEVADKPGVKAIIFRAPCIALFKPSNYYKVNDSKCVNCKKCIRVLGCPGIIIKDSAVSIDTSLCNGCGLCTQVCPTNAIEEEKL